MDCCALSSVTVNGDIEANPGPMHRQASTFPCGLCEEHVSFKPTAIAIVLTVTYETTCLEMCTNAFDELEKSVVSWICAKCNVSSYD